MRTPMLLDLFCGAGGCARGYQMAGFYVVGVDLCPQPRYCGDAFVQQDALEVLDVLLAGETWHGYHLSDFAAIHASPPCQGYSRARHLRKYRPDHKEHPLLLDAVRWRLQATGLPWVMENVAQAPMPHYLLLCGTMFDLKIYRHRQFESNLVLFGPGACQHPHELLPGYVCIYGAHTRGRQRGRYGNRYERASVEDGRRAMGISWMTQRELSQAIPPAYTEWIGRQLKEVLSCHA